MKWIQIRKRETLMHLQWQCNGIMMRRGLIFPAGNCKKSPLHGHCTRMRRSWFWMSQRQHLTHWRKLRCTKCLTGWWNIKHPYLSATAFPPAGSATRSQCLTMGRLYSMVRTKNWSRIRMGSIIAYGGHKRSIMNRTDG